MRFRLWTLAISLAILPLAGCPETPATPVGRLTVEPDQLSLPHGASARLNTHWEMTLPLAGSTEAPPHLFVHLLDDDARVLRTFDLPLPFDWQPGGESSAVVELWQSALDPPLPPGTWRLRMGLYDVASRRRWALEVPGGEEVGKEAYLVSRVKVPPGAGAEPVITFAGGWFPPEMSGDLQVLTRRWLERAGQISIAGLPGPAEVEIVVDIPELASESFSLVHDGGSTGGGSTGGGGAPTLTVTSDCAPQARQVSGFGQHRLALLLDPGATAGGVCLLHFDTDFVYVETSSLARRSLNLVRLTWGLASGEPAP